MSEPREFPVPLADDAEVAVFLAKCGKLYDPETDDYHREPFVADIREGKNDPIYNAHSYHTKVPARAIIPYILHYTEPGDVIMDPFCGSGMTGVAALMCEDPPEDIFQSVPGAKKGARRAILNDLSPAACHIAYNYCTPVDVEALKAEFERIKAAVKEEFDWLYGTEHYEPAMGLYDPTNPDVACRLKNPSPDVPLNSLLSNVERTWELLDRGEVERRMGTEPLAKQPLPQGVQQFICIPATIQYTIWSDVYKCQGIVTIEEPTGRINKRTQQSIVKKARRPRGCGARVTLWDVGVDHKNGEVRKHFQCSFCGQDWKKNQLDYSESLPVVTCYEHEVLSRKYRHRQKKIARRTRPTTARELSHLDHINQQEIELWYPDDPVDMGREMMRHGGIKRKSTRITDFYTRRNIRALARILAEIGNAQSERLRSALMFAFTGIVYTGPKLNAHHFGGQARPRVGTLFIPSLSEGASIFRLLNGKTKSLSG